MRYFKLTGFDGPRPDKYPFKDGAITRVRNPKQLPGITWSEQGRAWVTPKWVEVSDPSQNADESSGAACGLGVCAAEDGHEGTCDQASGWDHKDENAEIARQQAAHMDASLHPDFNIPPLLRALADEIDSLRAALSAAWEEGAEAGEQAGRMPSMYGEPVNPYGGTT